VGISAFALLVFSFCVGFFVVGLRLLLPKILPAWQDELVSRNLEGAIDYVKFFSRSHDAVIRVYDEAGNVIATHEHAGDFKEW
jgi:hypothetical protein